MTRVIIAAMLLFVQGAPRSDQTGSITGRVLDVNGKPAAHIRVNAVDVPVGAADAAILGVAETDDNGRYRLEGVPPGRHLISAGPLMSPTYYPGVARRARATLITVTEGTQLDGMDFSLVEPLSLIVSGRVIGLPNGGKRQITLFPAVALGRQLMSSMPTPSQVGADGSFKFTNVFPGSYQATISSATAGAGGQATLMPHSIRVIDEDLPGVVLRVRTQVSGTIAMEGGDPHPRFEITFAEVAPSSGSADLIRIPATKSFTMPLGSGNYRVTPTGLPNGFVIKSLSAGGVDLLSRPFTLSAGSTPLIVVKVGVGPQPPWIKVSGQVTGNVSDQVEVWATGSQLLEPLVVSTQRDGSFLFPKVVPGKYTLSASKGISPEVSIIVGNSDLQNVVIPSARLKDIPGRITIDGTGTPLPVTATFSISWTVAGSFPSAGSGSLVSPSVTIARVATVRSDGSFTVSLPEGESHITASPEMLAPGYRLQELRYGSRSVQGGPLSIKTEDSAHLEVRIGVDPGFPRITGRIVSARASMSERMMIYGPTVKAALQIEVKPDGTFQAPRLTTGTLLVRFFSSSPVPLPEIFIPAGASGVIEVSLPQIRSTPIHVTVEGGGAPPPFTLRLEGTIAAGLPSGKAAGSIGSPETRLLGLGVDIAPAPDGTFPLTLPDGEYQFGIVIAKPSSNRYALKSFRSRGVDLTKNPLKVGSTEDATIEVVFRKGR